MEMTPLTSRLRPSLPVLAISQKMSRGRLKSRSSELAVVGSRRGRALGELYIHEVTALVCCFVFPVVGAYLLHAIRNQLSRPSEGLVSNYNLTIFLLAAEIHPLSHLIKLVQARTLHLQRVVNASPFKREPAPTAAEVEELVRRLDSLESRADSGELAAQNGATLTSRQSRRLRWCATCAMLYSQSWMP